MSPKTLVTRDLQAWSVPLAGDGHRIECRCTLILDPETPVVVKVGLWHEAHPERVAWWEVSRALLGAPLIHPDYMFGRGDFRTSRPMFDGVPMLRLDLRGKRTRIVVETLAGGVEGFFAEVREVAPAAEIQDWYDGLLTQADAAARVWVDRYTCPRCRKVPRSLLAGCTDPICAAEQFRADLALDAQIEATDD